MKKSVVNPERRNFLRMLGLAGAGTVVAAAAAPMVFSDRFSSTLHQARQTRNLMNTYVQVTVLDKSAAKAEEAINNVFVEMARLEEVLTRFSASSAVAQLNASGKVGGAPREVMEVLAEARQLHQVSQGNFDITVLPLLNAVEAKVRAGHMLDSHDLAAASELVGFDKMAFSGGSINMSRSGMGITLDGIAKGYIVDKAIASLRAQGIEHALVNAGGDMRALGGKGSGQGWQILVQDPANKNNHLAKIELNDRAVATSGNYEAYFDSAKLFGHIVNPGAPASPATLASSSVIAPTCTMADGLATAVFVMGYKGGLAMINNNPKLGAMVIDHAGAQHSVRFA